MSAEKVARLLTDFDRPEFQKGSSRVVPFDHALHSSAKMQNKSDARSEQRPEPKPVVPPEEIAYQRGLSEGYAAAHAEYEQKLTEEKNRFSAELSEERHNLLDETATKIANELTELGKQLEANIAGVTARLLEPVISGIVQKQAVASFVEKLTSVASDSRRPVLRITGPAGLIHLVRSKLGAHSIAVEFRAEAVAEVSVIVDQVVLETQVKIWVDRLKFAVLA